MNIQETLRLHKLWLEGHKDGVQANMRGADMRGANMRDAGIRGADMRGANMRDAGIRGADMRGANMSWANLSDADMRGANLGGANLSDADMRGANLGGANLSEANMRGAKLPAFQITPVGYPLYGFKKLKGGVVATLLIPAEAKRTASLVGRKCRAEYVVVVDGEGFSLHDGVTKYTKGATVYPDKYDDDIRVECTSGIHFFLTREEAEGYN